MRSYVGGGGVDVVLYGGETVVDWLLHVPKQGLAAAAVGLPVVEIVGWPDEEIGRFRRDEHHPGKSTRRSRRDLVKLGSIQRSLADWQV